jgi:hypothetical protein
MYTTLYRTTGYTAPAKPTQFDWGAWKDTFKANPTLEPTVPCKECIYKELKLEDELDEIIFDDDDDETNLFGFERDSTPLFKEGEIDEDGFERRNRRTTWQDFLDAKDKALKKSIKCDCGTTFFIANPEVPNKCPSCEKEHPAQHFTYNEFLSQQKAKEAPGYGG